MLATCLNNHYLSHVGPSKGCLQAKELWKGPSRHRARGTGRAGVVAVALLGRMSHARSPNGIIGHVGTCLCRLASHRRSGASWQDPSITGGRA
jgi:hypothetical protein